MKYKQMQTPWYHSIAMYAKHNKYILQQSFNINPQSQENMKKKIKQWADYYVFLIRILYVSDRHLSKKNVLNCFEQAWHFHQPCI